MAKRKFHIINKIFHPKAGSKNFQEISSSLLNESFEPEKDDYYRQKWKNAQGEVPYDVKQAMWSYLKNKITQAPSPNKQFYLSNSYKSVAAILLPVFVVFSVYLYWSGKYYTDHNLSAAMSIITVDNGQKASLSLPDGTKVWINSGSELSFSRAFNGSNREVTLKGEAYFEVAKDKDRPFIVKTDLMNIQALGTAFNVKAYPNDRVTSSTLMEGKVKVYNEHFSTQMNPNQKITYDKTLRIVKQTSVDDAQSACLWRHNQLSFSSETLEEIALILERTYNITIRFESNNIKSLRFSGIIKNNSLQSVLQLIALAAPVNYSINDSLITLKSTE